MRNKTKDRLISTEWVSIIMPNFNGSRFLERSIKSILSQKNSNWELILVDDASTDNSRAIASKIAAKDRRIRLLINSRNRGVVYSLNKAIKLSNYEYIARIDSDDIWIDNNKLHKQIGYMLKHPETILVGTLGYKINTRHQVTSKIKYPSKDSSIRKYLLIENCFINSSILFRKSHRNVSVKYENEYKFAEDYALWLKLGQHGKIHNIPEYMVGYRTNVNSRSFTIYKDQIRDTIKAIKKYNDGYSFYPFILPLWHLRKIISRKIRERASGLFRDVIISTSSGKKFRGSKVAL